MNSARLQSASQRSKFTLKMRTPRPKTAQKRSPDTPHMESVYTVASQVFPHNRQNSANRLARQGEWETVRGKKSRAAELEQENKALKKTINELVENLAAAKGRTVTVEKRNEKYRKLQHIGDNEAYWTNPQINQHLIAGIRSQYDKLKDKYEALQGEYHELIKRKNVTRELEYVKYIEALEEALKRQQLQSQELTGERTEQELVVEVELLKDKLKMQHSKCILLKAKVEDRTLELKLKSKLLDEKDNQCHAIKKAQKKHADRIQELKDQLQNVHKELKAKTAEMEQEQKKWTGQIETNLDRHKADVQTLRKRYDEEIEFLRKENGYYSKIADELRVTNQQLSRDVQVANNSNANNNAASLLFTHLLTVESDKEAKKEEHRRRQSELQTSEWDGLWVDGKRVQQRADKAHHPSAEKKRRVDIADVEDTAELLKLKLMSKGVELKEMTALLEGKEEGWFKDYINLKQMEAILVDEPCGLDEEQARWLGRYLVEDIQQQFVWVHGASENSRSVVKSILGNVLSHYDLQKEAESELATVLENYGTTLKGTLQGFEPKGTITKKRLLDVLRYVGIECSDECRELIMARMAKRAQSLNALVHQDLFPDLPQ